MSEKKKSPWAGAKLLDEYDLQSGTRCPYCNHPVEGALLVGAVGMQELGAPKPGDINVCLNCTRISTYGKDMQLVMLDWDREQKIKKDPAVQTVLLSLRLARRERTLQSISSKQEK